MAVPFSKDITLEKMWFTAYILFLVTYLVMFAQPAMSQHFPLRLQENTAQQTLNFLQDSYLFSLATLGIKGEGEYSCINEYLCSIIRCFLFILCPVLKQVDKACLVYQEEQKHCICTKLCLLNTWGTKTLSPVLQLFKEIGKKVPVILPKKATWTKLRVFTYSYFQGLLKLKCVGTACTGQAISYFSKVLNSPLTIRSSFKTCRKQDIQRVPASQQSTKWFSFVWSPIWL